MRATAHRNATLAAGVAALVLLAAAPVPAQQAGAAPPMTLEAAERAFGLARSTDQLGYRSRTVSGGTITYGGVTLAGGLRARSLLLSIGTGDRAGRPVARLVNITAPGPADRGGASSASLAIAAIELTGIDPRLVDPARLSPGALRRGELGLRGDILVEGLSLAAGPDGDAGRFVVARLQVLGLEPGNNLPRFTRFEVNGLRAGAGPVSMQADTFAVAGLSDAVFAALGSQLTGTGRAAPDWTAMRIGEFSLRGVDISAPLPELGRSASRDPVALAAAVARDLQAAFLPGEVRLAQAGTADVSPGAARTRPAGTARVQLGEFTVRDLGMMDRTDFVLAGVSVDGVGEETGRFQLDRLSVDDMSMPVVLAALGTDLTPLDARQLARPVGGPEQGGPLGFFATGAQFGGLQIEAEGLRIRMDPMILTTRRDAAGQIVAWDIPAGSLTLALPDGPSSAQDGQPAPGADIAALIGRSDITVRWGDLQSVWDPATDRLETPAAGIAVDGFGSLQVSSVFRGYGAWARTRTLGDLAAYSTEVMAPALQDTGEGGPASGAAGARDARMLRAVARLYDGLMLESAGFAVVDSGALRLMVTPAPGTTKTGEQLRAELLEPLEATVADKSQPGLLRLMAQGLRAFIRQGGGTVRFTLAPPAPLTALRLAEPNLSARDLGFSVQLQPPAGTR